VKIISNAKVLNLLKTRFFETVKFSRT